MAFELRFMPYNNGGISFSLAKSKTDDFEIEHPLFDNNTSKAIYEAMLKAHNSRRSCGRSNVRLDVTPLALGSNPEWRASLFSNADEFVSCTGNTAQEAAQLLHKHYVSNMSRSSNYRTANQFSGASESHGVLLQCAPAN